MKTLTSKRSAGLVGLDIASGSIAATEVAMNGSPSLGRSAVAALEPGIAREGEVADVEALGGALKQFFAEHDLPSTVRVGIANQRVVVRTLRLPLIEKSDEIAAAIRFQAVEQIPMPLDQAVVDWQVLSSNAELAQARQMEIVVVAARREMIDDLTAAVRAAGLKPIGIDVSAFAMIRALADTAQTNVLSYEEREAAGDAAAASLPQPAYLYCHLGDITNLAVARGSDCTFTRIASFGVEGIAQALAERHELTLVHAREWLAHVGLDRPTEEIDGDPAVVEATRTVLQEGSARLAGELRLSLDYYGAQESAVAIEEIVVCGPGSSIAGLPALLQAELGYPLRVGRPPALADLDPGPAARLTLAYGLALES